jgi:hypothetical protein
VARVNADEVPQFACELGLSPSALVGLRIDRAGSIDSFTADIGLPPRLPVVGGASDSRSSLVSKGVSAGLLLTLALEAAERLNARPVVRPSRDGQGRELIGDRCDQELMAECVDARRALHQLVISPSDFGNEVQRPKAGHQQLIERGGICRVGAPVDTRLGLAWASVSLAPATFSIGTDLPNTERTVRSGCASIASRAAASRERFEASRAGAMSKSPGVTSMPSRSAAVEPVTTYATPCSARSVIKAGS